MYFRLIFIALACLSLNACLPNTFGPTASPLISQPPFGASPEQVDARLRRYVGVRCDICSAQADMSLSGLPVALSLRYAGARLAKLYFSGEALNLPASRATLEARLIGFEDALRSVYGEPEAVLGFEPDALRPGSIRPVLRWPVRDEVRATLGVGRYEFAYYPVVVLEHLPPAQVAELSQTTTDKPSYF